MSLPTRVPKKLVVFAVLALALAGLVLIAVPSAAANVRTGNGGDVPFYARLDFHDDEWAVIVFYRPPGCIPDNFNLLDFFDGNAFACGPPTTDGFQIWENGPTVDEAPLQSVLHGLGSVPVWFVGWPELQAVMADGDVTITELEAMSTLRSGVASTFQEVLHPEGGGKNNIINYVASGSLADGGSFWVHAWGTSAAGKANVRITLND
jgi:hypothetical protein